MAAASFSVTSSQHTLELDGQGQGEAVFTVTNTTDLPKRAQLKMYAQGGTNTSWLTLDGDPARDFTPKGTQQVSVTVKVPQGTPPGSYTFRLHAISTSNPQEDYTEGPWITMAVLKTGVEPEKPVRMGVIIGLVVAAVVVIGGVIGYVVCCTGGSSPEQVFVKSFVGQQIGDARDTLKVLKLEIIEIPDSTSESPEGEVVAQDIADTEMNEGDTITLTVAAPPEMVEMPPLKGALLSDAKDKLEGNFEILPITPEWVKWVINDTDVDKVIEQSLTPFSKHPRGTKVQLKVNKKGVKVPRLTKKGVAENIKTLTAHNLAFGGHTGNEDATKVPTTTPNTGEIVAPGSEVILNFPGPPRKIGWQELRQHQKFGQAITDAQKSLKKKLP